MRIRSSILYCHGVSCVSDSCLVSTDCHDWFDMTSLEIGRDRSVAKRITVVRCTIQRVVWLQMENR